MGVHGLWELLSPVGRRVSVETLAGKKLAIDASIWMVQFIKAMRDERGEMVRNAHLLGFFRRICKLLFLRTKPVFVFDGATPALKRRTLIARRRQRENAQAKVRKTAEKLLLNHLKAMRLRELAEDLQKQKQGRDVPKKKILQNHNATVDSNSENDKGITSCESHENLDEILAASIMAEENEIFTRNGSSSIAGATFSEPGRHDVDPDVLSTLPSQHEVQKQNFQSDLKGKKILSDETHVIGSGPERIEVVSGSSKQQNLDEMLAASIAAEEAGSLNDHASVSAAAILDVEDPDDDDEDEEMILPEMHGVVDPSVLAALPPSMQLDLLVQMRERLMAENRQKYQRVKKDPAKFSELQIQAYLKTVAFRRDIDQVQKAASGRGLGGVQTSRIASEANREFIFSSSFTGDKEVLASTKAGKSGDKDQQASKRQQPLGSLNNTEVPIATTALAQSNSEKTTDDFDDNIETYLDERGRVRVSRVKAMGMHMTRDLERNLNLMKEIEKNTDANKVLNPESVQNIEICNPKSFSSQSQVVDIPHEGVSESIMLNERSGGSMLNDDTSLEILLEDDGAKLSDGDDDLFTRLVAENPLQMASFDVPSQKPSPDWEEAVEGKGCIPENVDMNYDHSFKEGIVSDESEVEWEEVICNHVSTVPCGNVTERPVSKGSLEEEAALQEAIRRSLEVVGPTKSDPTFSEHEKMTTVGKIDELCNIQNENLIGLEKSYDADGMNCLQANDFTGSQCSEAVVLSGPNIHVIAEQLDDAHKDTTFSGKESKENIDIVDPLSRDTSSSSQVGDRKDNTVIEPPGHMVEMENISSHIYSLPKGSTDENSFKQNFPADKSSSDLLEETDARKPAFEENSSAEVELTEAELTSRISFLEQERLNLGNEQKKLERNAESASSEMFAECQELLQMFGLPYIIAPMEAEAQCAHMELANLVDGVVTDDSDVFLFGARSVYKNIFDDRKYVETYYMKDVENELGLDRDKLIRMALLLGSDYTEGISGIGIVNAIEVVNAFPEEDGLRKFKEWIESPDPNIFGKLDAETGSSARKRGSKESEKDVTCSNSTVRDGSASGQNMSEALKQKESAGVIDIRQSFMDTHRNVSKNWHIPSAFPSEAVISAYICPQVDKSAEPFSWGKPDHFVLRRLCWEKFGWDSRKADELLLPVLKEYGKHETQLRMEAFYTFNERFAKIRSKRIKKAVKGITGSQSAVLMDDAVQDVSVNRKEKRSDNFGEKAFEKCSSEIEGACLNEIDDVENRLSKPSGKRKLCGDPSQSAKGLKLTTKERGNQGRNKGPHKNVRGRGRGRGRERGRLAPKGKAKGTSSTELVETSSSDGENEYDYQEVDLENMQESQERRRSTRIRKCANYIIDDVEPSDHSGKRHSDDEAVENDVAQDQHACDDTVNGQSEDIERELEIPKKTPHEDYLATGGGFYPVDDEASQEGMHQDEDLFLEANISEDYYKMGGGFCLVEGNECVDPDASHDPATVSEDPKDGSDGGLGHSTLSPENLLGKVQNREGSDSQIDTVFDVDYPNPASNPNSSQADKGLQADDVDGHTVTVSVGALNAMPNLRRKRRKY